MKKNLKTFILLGIAFCSIENVFSTNEDVELKEKKARPVWNNQDIQPALKNIFTPFYRDKRKPNFLEDFQLMYKFNKLNANKYLNNFVNQLNITMTIDKIEDLSKKFNIITLRPLTKNKIILSCGNYITDGHNKSFPNHCGRDFHQDADTVDVDVSMNPTVVADLNSSSFYEYLLSENKRYDEIIAEGGYTLHNPKRLEMLRRMLNINGRYKVEVGNFFSIINANEEKNLNKLLNDAHFYLLLSQEKFQEIVSMDLKSVANTLLEEMGNFYKKHGFDLLIQHPEFFILQQPDFEQNKRTSYTYIIGRTEIEAADVTLVRVK